MGDTGETGKKSKTRYEDQFWLMVCWSVKLLDVVEDGNPYDQVHYDGISRRFWIKWRQNAAAAIYHPSLQDKGTAIRRLLQKHDGSAAARRQGLHFTPELLQASRLWVSILPMWTLHVGLGTFRSVKVENITGASYALRILYGGGEIRQN